LENTIQRGLQLCDNKKLQADHIGIERKVPSVIKGRTGTLREMEQELIGTTLCACKKNMAKTAKCLGISRATLYRKVREYGLAEANP
jgi:DNA-binding NtrC family response regulator